MKQFAKATQGVPVHQPILAQHEADILHFGVAGGEVVMPEERQLLAKRMRRIEHPVRPPRPQVLIVVIFGGLFGQVVSLKIKAVLPRIALEKLIDRFFRPGFQTRFQLLPGGAEPSSPREMPHFADIPG